MSGANLRALLKDARRRLGAVSETALLDAEIMLAHVLDKGRLFLHLEPMFEPTAAQLQAFEKMMARRLKAEPVAYILGEQEFWSLKFKVNQHTLIPRPDSETIIDKILKDFTDVYAPLTVADLGTGSGCLLLATLSEFPKAKGWAIDRSTGAVKVSNDNAVALELAERATIEETSWYDDAAMMMKDKVDILISNAPYIPTADIADLAPDVRDYEPTSALDGGQDGLNDVRHIIGLAKKLLLPSGHLYLEIGYHQADDTAELLKAAGFRDIDKTKDLGGIERVVSGKFLD